MASYPSAMDGTRRGAPVREIAHEVPEGLEKGLRNYWYPVLQSEELPHDRPVGVRCLSEDLVAWRDGAGRPCVATDRCPHRAAALSRGRVLEGNLQCIFHGLRFAGDGRCVLIPWEPEDSPLLSEVAVRAYPAEERGGYVWAYIGDPSAFPPPPLRDETPEELWDEEHFVWFRLPTEIWDANWLTAIDGSDAIHAVTLHAEAQAVADEAWKGGDAARPAVPLENRRIKILETPHGARAISVDRDGKHISHGHATGEVKGARFALPCVTTNPITPAKGALPYTSRLWQFPVDETRTRIVRYVCWKLSAPEDRGRAEQVFNDLAWPRLKKISAEDAMICAAQGDLVAARSAEFLFDVDMDVVRIRRQLRDAFLAQLGGPRVATAEGALVHPL